MTGIFERLRKLILAGDVRVSSHGYDELAEDEFLARDAVQSIENAQLIDEYLRLFERSLRFGPAKGYCRRADTCRLGYTQGEEFSCRFDYRLSS